MNQALVYVISVIYKKKDAIFKSSHEISLERRCSNYIFYLLFSLSLSLSFSLSLSLSLSLPLSLSLSQNLLFIHFFWCPNANLTYVWIIKLSIKHNHSTAIRELVIYSPCKTFELSVHAQADLGHKQRLFSGRGWE